jgi:type II secretion system protein H
LGKQKITLKTALHNSHDSAFTFIELVLVLCLLAVLCSLIIPQMKGFFHGRKLEYEAQRFLALTRYAQSRAVSEGVPMILWVDSQQRTYGLEAQNGYGLNETNQQQFTVDESLQVQVDRMAGPLTQSNLWTQVRVGIAGRPELRFLPDGTISESSPNQIALRQSKVDVLFITETTNHLRYEIHQQ